MTQHGNHRQNPNYGNPRNTHRSQNNRYQQGRQYSRKDALEAQLRRLESDVLKLDARIDAAFQKGIALEAAKNQHMGSIPWAIAQVALSTLGVRYLPPVARTWHYRHQEYLRAEQALRLYCIDLNTQREALVAEIERIQIQLDVLQFHP